ncbi:MAG: L,D-transpeptidase [Pseudomonadota bacterium]
MLTRRHFVSTAGALFSTPIASAAFGQSDPSQVVDPSEVIDAPIVPEEAPARAPISDKSRWAEWDRRVTPANYDPATSNPWGFHPRFLPQLVQANDGLRPGDIHVDAVARYLYHIREGGTAMRYGVAIAKGDLYEPGTYSINVKKKWPTWRPTDDMIERDPAAFERYADGMDGGPSNPLGSRAFYLFEGRRDTYLRIHGTPYPRSIGGRASSGCVRMVMAHIIGLYDQVAIGSTAYLYSPNGTVTARS